MDAVNTLQQVLSLQRAMEVLTVLALTAYLFPKQAVVFDNQEFDFIVVGAGSAGTVVAYRLAECNFNVLLIEAGGDPPVASLLPALYPFLPRTAVDWNYTNVPLSDQFQCFRARTLNLTTGHVLGGGSSDNYMFYVRGCPGDFSSWETAANDSSWSYDGMLPYFIRSERLEDKEILSSRTRRFHGTRGFLGVTRDTDPKALPYLESFRELGNDILLDINADRGLGYTRQTYTIAEGIRQSTAFSILSQRKNPNLKLLRNTFVTRILFDETNNAIGVTAINEDNNEITLRAKHEVIVSAGSLNSARLLMSSGIGPEEHLTSLNISVRKNLPVGQNLHDHAPIILSLQMEESNEPLPPTNPHKFPVPVVTGYVALNKSQKCPTYQAINTLIPAGSKGPMELCVFNFGFQYDICQNFYEGGRNRNTVFVFLIPLHPKTRGTVLLRSSNPRDPPLINLRSHENSEDIEVYVDSVMDFMRVLNTSYFRSVNAEMTDLKLRSCGDMDIFSRDWWRCYVRCLAFTLFHYVGTCALGSVVDNKLRVFGVGRLRVIDAGIMPRIVGANTNAASIAIGEKGADTIIKEYGCRDRSLFNLLHHKLNLW